FGHAVGEPPKSTLHQLAPHLGHATVEPSIAQATLCCATAHPGHRGRFCERPTACNGHCQHVVGVFSATMRHGGPVFLPRFFRSTSREPMATRNKNAYFRFFARAGRTLRQPSPRFAYLANERTKSPWPSPPPPTLVRSLAAPCRPRSPRLPLALGLAAGQHRHELCLIRWRETEQRRRDGFQA